jgi:very-short-patch-repair endonuclease
MHAAGLPQPTLQYRFDEHRLWRLDFSWPLRKVAVEVEGGVWINGGHNRASGFLRDAEKYNTLALLGWRLYRFPTDWVVDGRAVRMLCQEFQS